MIKEHLGAYLLTFAITFVATISRIQITNKEYIPKEKREEILKPYKATEQPIDSLQKLLIEQEKKTKR